MNQTGIEWCDRTWNPMTGCKHGCSYCYARQVAEMRKKAFPKGFEPVFHDARLDLPAKEKAPQTIFVGSMTDMMGAWWYKNEIEAVIDVCDASPHHTFLWLTKNPARYASFIWPDNCWLGTTITNQADADERIPALLRTADVKRFLSIEPMIGAMDIEERTLYCPWTEACEEQPSSIIHQVILGGETGRDARPMHPNWVRSVRDQCAAAGVPFFFKSWGEWLPKSHWTQEMRKDNWKRLMWGTLTGDGTYFNTATPFNGHDDDGHGGEAVMVRVGKKAAGRLLDGREHNDLAWRI